MAGLIELQVTIITLVICGIFLKKRKILGEDGQKVLTDLVINLVLPCNIVTSFTVSISKSALTDCLHVFLISIGIQITAVLYGKLISRKLLEDERVIVHYATVTSNAGLLGNPVAEGLFGPVGLMLASVFLVPVRVMMWSEGIALFTGTKDRKQMLRNVLTHPCVIACLTGIVLLIGNIRLPSLIMGPIQTLGRCNNGLCMLIMGMIIADADLKTMITPLTLKYTLHRLIILPLIVFAATRILPVTPLAGSLCTILTAMPAAVTTSLLASRYDRAPVFAATLVIFSTLCSVITTAIWSMVLL